MLRPNHATLSSSELRLRRKRLRIILLSGLVLVFGLAVFFAARPARDSIKSWQARRHAQKALAFIEQEKWQAARDEAVAGYRLRPTEPQALRAVARFLSRTRQPQALEFWDRLEKRAQLNQTDLHDEAEVALALNETARAGAAIQKLLSASDPAPGPAEWLLAAQAAAQKGSAQKVDPYLEKILSDSAATERQQFQAAVLRVATAAQDKSRAGEEGVAAVWNRIVQLSHGSSSTSLDALLVLAQRSLSQPTPGEGTSAHPLSDGASSSMQPGSTADGFPSADDLASALERHPLAKPPHKLLAFDLRLHANPAERDALIAKAIEDWKDAEPSGLVALAMWLNGKGEYQRQLDTISLERAVQTRELFLQHVDALGALGRWEEIKRLLESERYPLDPVIQRMYLARCNAQLGQVAASENNWQRALEAAGGDVSKLMALAPYAEKNGATGLADAAYTAAAAQAPNFRAAQEGRLRMAQASKETRKIHSVLAEMRKLWPNDSAIMNDEAYLRLLLAPDDPSENETLAAIEKIAEQLVQEGPASLPHKTLLALARLRQHRPATALQVYEDLHVPNNALTPSALAVHAAVLAANGNMEAGREEMANVDSVNLLPEEEALVAALR